VTRTIEGTNEGEVRGRLEGEGYRVFSVELTKLMQGMRFRQSRHIRIKPDDFLLFNQQFAALLKAGLPVLQSVQMLRQRSPNAKLRTVLADIEARIKSGSALSEAFAAQGETFPKIYSASILAGERSGNIDDVLRRYVAYTKSVAALRRKIKSALTYPVILLVAAMGLITVLTTFVIPRFATIYENMNAQLPLVTVVVVGVSTAVGENLYWLGPTLIVAIIAFIFWRRTESGRRTIDGALLKIPIIGTLIRQMTTAQVSRSLATLLAGGITLVESFDIAQKSITNRQLLRMTEPVGPQVREGKSFADSLAGAGWVPELATDMIGVGERSGSLREMLDEVASFYDAETEVKLGQLTTFIEPAILISMGLIVVTILLAIYLPLLQMVSRAGSG